MRLPSQIAVKGEEHLIAMGLGKQLAWAGLGKPQVEEEREEQGWVFLARFDS